MPWRTMPLAIRQSGVALWVAAAKHRQRFPNTDDMVASRGRRSIRPRNSIGRSHAAMAQPDMCDRALRTSLTAFCAFVPADGTARNQPLPVGASAD